MRNVAYHTRGTQSSSDHSQHKRNAAEVKRGLGQHCFAREAWRGDSPRHTDGPIVVDVAGIGECYQEAGIGDLTASCRSHLANG